MQEIPENAACAHPVKAFSSEHVLKMIAYISAAIQETSRPGNYFSR